MSALHHTGHELHENEAADVRCRSIGQRRQGGEGLGFVFAVNAGRVRIHDEQRAPSFREIGTHEDGRGAVVRRRGRRRR